MKFTTFNVSIALSEAICESWESIIDKIVKKRFIVVDGYDAEVGTTDKRMLIYSSGATPAHESVRKLLKASIVKMYRLNFSKPFLNSTSLLMSQYLISEVIDRTANSECPDMVNFNAI